MQIRILICENQHQYAKNLKNMRNNDFVYRYSDIAFCFYFVFKQLVDSSVAIASSPIETSMSRLTTKYIIITDGLPLYCILSVPSGG